MQRRGGFKLGEKGSCVCNSSWRGAEADCRRKDWGHPIQERKQEDVCRCVMERKNESRIYRLLGIAGIAAHQTGGKNHLNANAQLT